MDTLVKPPKQKTYLGLFMIVKNESKIIERCLNSTKGLIDFVSICDTGSSDDTPAIIEKWLEENKIPGRVHIRPWKGFGPSRTDSFLQALEVIKELGIPRKDTYLLTLDADMVLQHRNPEKPLKKKRLREKGYMLMQKAWDSMYNNPRILGAWIPWICRWRTHEIWQAPGYGVPPVLDDLWIDDRNDGGAKADKFPRDEKLLLEDLAEFPNEERLVFYLAQTYMCMGPESHHKAYDWYKRRTEMGGFWEEKYYSLYQMGCIARDDKKDWGLAQQHFLAAFNLDSRRAEPLYEIAKYHREKGNNALACMFAEKGMALPLPRDALFVTYAVYDYLLHQEMSISGFYVDRTKGFKSCDFLTMYRKAPDFQRNEAYNNMNHYIQHLDCDYMPIQITGERLQGSRLRRSVALNPSIIASPCNGDGGDGGSGNGENDKQGVYLVNCRTVNYLIQNHNHYLMGANQKIQTYSFWLRYDKNLDLVSKQLVYDASNAPRHESNVEGFEDCRMTEWNGRMYALCTTKEYHPDAHDAPLMALMRYAPIATSGNEENRVAVDKVWPLQSLRKKTCEKNWLPFVHDGKLMCIYDYEPFTILQLSPPDNDSSGCQQTVVEEKLYQLNLGTWRGSAAPIPYRGGYLFVIHEVRMKDNRRVYYHRFVFMNAGLRIIKFSFPFTFMGQGIEYVAGMALAPSGDELILGLGIEDREAYLAIVPVSTMEKILVEEMP